MNITDILHKSTRYAEIALKECGYSTYILGSEKELKARPTESHNPHRVGLLIRNGRVANYKVG